MLIDFYLNFFLFNMMNGEFFIKKNLVFCLVKKINNNNILCQNYDYKNCQICKVMI